MKNKNKTMISLFVVLDIVIVVVLVTWAWIEGTTNPGITGSNMKISAAPGLIMKVSGTSTDEINLNDYLYDQKEKTLTLAEASSSDGKNIFIRTTKQDGDANEEKVYLSSSADSDKNSNYLSVDFTLTAVDGAQKIWLDPEKSYITEDGKPLNAVRTSLEVHNDTRDSTTIMSMRDANPSLSYARLLGVKKLASNGEMINDIPESGEDGTYMINTSVFPIQGYSLSNPLIDNLDENETVNVTLRVWLEGTDAECLDTLIAGHGFEFSLYFDAKLN